MVWTVVLEDAFDEEFKELSKEVQDELLASAKLLEEYGPQLKRPHSDTLNDSDYKNMKELRFDADDGVWRVAYAFDPGRKGILLVAGDKSGINQDLFYKKLIDKADKRYKAHLEKLEAAKKEKK